MNIFASSDHHFFHRNIIQYANRPFDIKDENCVVDNAKLMVQKHNEVVTNNDVAILVGDLSCGLRDRHEVFSNILKLLNGKKILVRGNHDYEPDQFYLDAGFLAVVDYIHAGNTFISHYPCYTSRFTSKSEKIHINHIKGLNINKIIHGHIHNKCPGLWESDGIDRTNVCVDFTPNGFYPVEITDDNIVKHFVPLKNYK